MKVFLIAKGVEALSLSNNQYNIKELLEKFLENKGIIYACGTCLKFEVRRALNFGLCNLWVNCII